MSSISTEARALRDAFGAFTTGVTVITARTRDGREIGFTANSFTSVSLDPPLLLVCVAKTSRNFDNVTKAAGFGVNILSEAQQDVSNTFARPVEDRFAGVEWRPGPAGSPVFPDAAAWFDCRVEQVIDAGDHAVLLGHVVGFVNTGRNGLGYARGSYFSPNLAAKAARAAAEGERVVGVVAERNGDILLTEAGDGRWSLPQWVLGSGEATDDLAERLRAETGLDAAIGFLFSVFEDRREARQHVVYRATVGEGTPTKGRFFATGALPMSELDDGATRDILRRFVAESSIGDFGVYVGNETAGQVHSIAQGGSTR